MKLIGSGLKIRHSLSKHNTILSKFNHLRDFPKGEISMNLPHPLDRPYQQEAYNRIANSKVQYVIAKLKTGLGKTALPAQLAVDSSKVLACVMTKSLQWQYVNPYQFTTLFGKGNYECKGYGQQVDMFGGKLTADLCEVPKEWRDECKSCCEYPLVRWSFILAQAGVTNYSKFLTDRTAISSNDYVKGFDPHVLVFDEAHELSDLVVSRSGFTASWKHKYLQQYVKPIELDIDNIMRYEKVPEPIARMRMMTKVENWLLDFKYSLSMNVPKHPFKGGNLSLWKWHRMQTEKVDELLDNIKIEPNCWYVYANEEGIVIKPLTARFHFRKLFEKADKIVMMSATIQHKDITSLGIEKFDFINMPNPYPPQDRPIHDLKAPKITAKTSLNDCQKHAQIIANVFNRAPDWWNGIVHMPSKKKSEDWGEWLEQMTHRPIWIPQRDMSTDEAQQEWQQFEQSNTGAIACCWNMMTGVDGKNININITGCVPYPNFGDRFEKERFDYSPGEARVRVANLIEQQQGRNRRGFVEHYGKQAEKYNGIADGKWERLKSAFDKDFLASIC